MNTAARSLEICLLLLEILFSEWVQQSNWYGTEVEDWYAGISNTLGHFLLPSRKLKSLKYMWLNKVRIYIPLVYFNDMNANRLSW